jgi:hypothetical protein
MKPITLIFKPEKETRNTVRYAEVSDGPPVVGYVYLQKSALGPAPYPKQVQVTVSPVPEATS